MWTLSSGVDENRPWTLSGTARKMSTAPKRAQKITSGENESRTVGDRRTHIDRSST